MNPACGRDPRNPHMSHRQSFVCTQMKERDSWKHSVLDSDEDCLEMKFNRDHAIGGEAVVIPDGVR